MPLTGGQITAIDRLVNGWDDEEEPFEHHRGLNEMVNDVISAREDVRALVRIDDRFTDANCTLALGDAKLKGKTAAEELVALFT